MTDQTRILIVEDNRTVRATVRDVLRDEGYKVKGARSYNKAVKRLRNHPFDVVFTDHSIGKHSGYEVIQVANQTRPNARIVLMSGQVVPTMVQEVAVPDTIWLLPKPFGMTDLLSTVKDLLNETPLSSE